MDIESMVARVWAPEVKPLVQEAWRSYGVGAIRAAITTTWVAVATDLFGKIALVAEDGDAAAATFAKSVRDAQGDPRNKAKIAASMKLEQDVIATARSLELIDGIAERDLDRLKEDRNLCAHPSLRNEEVIFDPRAETARAHLAIALDSLLIHPPQQGKSLVESFVKHLASPHYVHSPVHVAAAYYDNVQPRVRKSLAVVAAKHALRAIPLDGADADEVARRAAQVLDVLAQRDRAVVTEAFEKAAKQFRPDTEQLMAATSRLGGLTEFWNILDDGQCALLNDVIRTRMRQEDLNAGDGYTQNHRILAAVVSPVARERVPQLQIAYETLPNWHRTWVMWTRPDGFFTKDLAGMLRDAKSWRGAEHVMQFAVQPHAGCITHDQLDAILTAWVENVQAREASAMPPAAVEFFHETRHLRPGSLPLWRRFQERAAELSEDMEYYHYTAIKDLLATS